MRRVKSFIRKSIVGGLLVVSPAIILYVIFQWAFQAVGKLIHPLAAPIVERSSAPELVIDLLVILMIIIGCFFIGTIATTGIGKWLHARFDKTLTKLAPGYNLVRDIVHQFLGDQSSSPFAQGEVARVRLFGSDVATEVTAIVTSTHHNNWLTVFVPTGPNPTSGMIYHLPPEQVVILPDTKVDEALRTIIACGAGSGELFARQ